MMVRAGESAKLLMFAAMALVAAGAVATEVSSERDVTAELEAVLRAGEAIGARSGSAQEIADAFYEDDLTITGEGEKFYPNLQSFMTRLYEHTRNPTCRMKIVDRVRHSGDIAVAWVAHHCEANGQEPASDYRVMYVFRDGPKGWRVTMEMFTSGTF